MPSIQLFVLKKVYSPEPTMDTVAALKTAVTIFSFFSMQAGPIQSLIHPTFPLPSDPQCNPSTPQINDAQPTKIMWFAA